MYKVKTPKEKDLLHICSASCLFIGNKPIIGGDFNMSTIIRDTEYSTVENSLSKAENRKLFKDTIDIHMANNISCYASFGPVNRPVFHTSESDAVFKAVGVPKERFEDLLKIMQKSDSRWKIKGVDYPFYLAIVLAIRYFTLKHDDVQIKNSLSYMVCFTYALVYAKYYKKTNPTESIMAYAINNMSNKYRIKTSGNLWTVLYESVEKAYQLHKKGMTTGEDDAFVRFVADVRTRINSFIRKISNAYYAAFTNGQYLQSESESFEDDKYYEADSNTLAVERVTNKVLTRLIVSGPDAKLIELAAKNCGVSVNVLRTYIQSMVTDEQKDDIRVIVESLLFLYLFTESTDKHTIRDIGTNDFLIYCMKVYKKSNTIDPNVLKIKAILDKWLKELGLITKHSSPTTTNNFRRALYMFFIMTIMKSN